MGSGTGADDRLNIKLISDGWRVQTLPFNSGLSSTVFRTAESSSLTLSLKP
jgi:hypothetical protein